MLTQFDPPSTEFKSLITSAVMKSGHEALCSKGGVAAERDGSVVIDGGRLEGGEGDVWLRFS